jgi:GNAT superfamily N-acetyltransferase
MSTECRVRRLGRGDEWRYRPFTFPALRSLLDRIDSDEVIGMVAETADGNPVGLALGRVSNDPADGWTVELLSIYVHPDQRRRGIGVRLTRAFVQACRDHPHLLEIRATFMTGSNSTPAVLALLGRGGWTDPAPRMWVIEATLDSIRAAPWMKSFPIPEGMEIVPWLALSQADRDRIASSQQLLQWIPQDLYPFDHEAHCEPITSLALRHQGEVVGWVINHRVGDILRYTCSFMHRRLQRMGRILLLYNEAVARMPQAGLTTGMWTVPVWHPGMSAFAKRWMAPYATRFEQTLGSRLVLRSAAEN